MLTFGNFFRRYVINDLATFNSIPFFKTKWFCFCKYCFGFLFYFMMTQTHSRRYKIFMLNQI